jgi:hypothetical protein
MKVTSDNTNKSSRYLEAGTPTKCFLQGCRRAFGQSCHRGLDNRYYCSQRCAEIGLNAELLKIESLRKKRA